MSATLNIAREYSRSPAGRFRKDGPATGERFREDFLKPALESNEYVEVNLNDTGGYGSSFLEESFGGLIRTRYLTLSEFRRRIKLTASGAHLIYKRAIEAHVEKAARDLK